MSQKLQEILDNPNATNRLGKYELHRKLADGGMATLFLARQAGPGGFSKPIALKCILPELSNKADFVTMLTDEARVAGLLHHPNIVQTFELGHEEGVYFIAMELVPGFNLKQLARKIYKHKQPPPPEQLYPALGSVMMQAAAGLHHAHTATDEEGRPLKLVHRDISPTNILLGFNGHVKLVDFGVAKAATQQHQTKVGMLKGKICYMSPEQVDGGTLDHRSDIFSFGIVCYELITNRQLFSRSSNVETIMAVAQGPIVPPRQHVESIPPALDQIIMRALQRHPDKRYPTADALRQDLRAYLQSEGSYYDPEQLRSWLAPYCDQEDRERYKVSSTSTSGLDLSSGQHLTPAQGARLPDSGGVQMQSKTPTFAYSSSPGSGSGTGSTGSGTGSTGSGTGGTGGRNRNKRSLLGTGRMPSFHATPPIDPPRANPHISLAPPLSSSDPLDDDQSLDFQTRPPLLTIGIGAFVTLLLVGVLAFFAFGPEARPPIDDELKQVERLIDIKKFGPARTKLDKLSERIASQGGSANTAVWKARVGQLDAQLKAIPQLELARQLYNEGKHQAARTILEVLRKQYPGVPGILPLLQKVQKVQKSLQSTKK